MYNITVPNKNKKERYKMRYLNNPWYTVIDGTLYFICPGGKHIKIRDAIQGIDYDTPTSLDG